MAPQPFSRRFQGDNQVDDPGYPQSWGDKIETSDPPSRKIFPNASLVPREATTFGTSRLVTGLVTVNVTAGLPTARTREKNTAQPTVRMETTQRHTQTKPSTRYKNSRETTQKQPNITNPPPR